MNDTVVQVLISRVIPAEVEDSSSHVEDNGEKKNSADFQFCWSHLVYELKPVKK